MHAKPQLNYINKYQMKLKDLRNYSPNAHAEGQPQLSKQSFFLSTPFILSQIDRHGL